MSVEELIQLPITLFSKKISTEWMHAYGVRFSDPSKSFENEMILTSPERKEERNQEKICLPGS